MDAVLRQWLLNLAIDFPVPLRLLPSVLDGDDRDAHPLNVRSRHGFTLDYGVRCLAELADSGLITFTYASKEGESRVVAPSEVLTQTMGSAVQDELAFELTEAGGLAWEKTAAPRWYDLEDGYADPRCENGEVTGWRWTRFSQNREHLMAVLGWFPMLQGGEQLDLDSVAWRLHDDYKVKYWKRLPNVYVANFDTRLADGSQPAWNHGSEPEWFKTWVRERARWYRQPWEMDGWPPAPEP